jgi:hypothetical protein
MKIYTFAALAVPSGLTSGKGITVVAGNNVADAKAVLTASISAAYTTKYQEPVLIKRSSVAGLSRVIVDGTTFV